MYSLTVRDHIFIAHSLKGEVFGPAQNLHGATYIVDAEFKRETLDENNIVFDIGLASGVLRDALAGLNYKNLDAVEEFASRPTTVEFLSKHIHDQISARVAPFFKGRLKVTMQESPWPGQAMRQKSPKGSWGEGFQDVFVLPEDSSSPSGGNLYNKLLLGSLRKEGLRFRTMTLGEALSSAGPGFRARYWVDSLYFDALKEAACRNALGPHLFLVVHQLLSLDPTLPREDAARREREEWSIFRGAAGVLVTGPHLGQVLLERGTEAGAIITVRPALTVSPTGRRSGSRGFRGAIVSNLIRRKGILEFLACLGERLLPSDRFAILIAGRSDIEPEYSAACLREIDLHPLLKRNVRYLGPLSSGEMKSLYKKSTLFIAPSLVETYGLAFHEARAFGLPLMAIRAPYSEPYVRSGKNGCLYATIGSLARGCLELIRHPDRLSELRERAWRARDAPNYSWRDAGREFMAQLRAWEQRHPPNCV